MKRLKRVLAVLLIVIITIPVIYFVSLTLIYPAINDARAEKIKEEYLNIELPPQTEIVETYNYCGNITGTGNHVEIWAGALIKSELPEAELFHWYEEMKISYVAYEPLFWPVPEDLTSQYPETHSFIEFTHFNSMTEAKGYYIIGSYYDAVTQHDIRGH